jgi:molecular chaperone DnaJ
LNKHQKKLFEELQESLGQSDKSHSPKQHSWFEGVKTFFDDMKS